MSQVDQYTIPGSPLAMAALATHLESLFAAAVSCNRGASAPNSPFEGMLWWDTSGNPVEELKRYTVAQGWRSIGSVNITTGAVFLNVQAATTSVSGRVELATSPETVTGTDTERAVTPAGLQAKLVGAQATVSLVSSGGFTAGTLKCVRIGNVVTITATGNITHSSSDIVDSASGVIPSNFRPSSTVQTTFATYGTVQMDVQISSGGTFSIAYTGHNGSPSNQTSTNSRVLTISYVVTSAVP